MSVPTSATADPAPVLPPERRRALVRVLGEALSLGFLGPRPVDEQLDHALAYGPLVVAESGAIAVDLGSGGGVPGLVLAVLRPELRWQLVDAMEKRTAFLVRAAAQLEVAVEVVTARAEDFGRSQRGTAEVVVSRSFGPPAVLAECAAPLLRVGGTLLVSEPPGGDETRWPAGPLDELGLQLRRLVVGPPAFAVLGQVRPAPPDVPRRNGVPAKRPRW